MYVHTINQRHLSVLFHVNNIILFYQLEVSLKNVNLCNIEQRAAQLECDDC